MATFAWIITTAVVAFVGGVIVDRVLFKKWF